MNSFVSVEDQDVSCDDFDGFVFSASAISGSSVDSDRKSEKYINVSNNDFLNYSSDNSSSEQSKNIVLCMAQGRAGRSRAKNRLCEYRPTESNFGPNLEGKLDYDSGIHIDSNLIPLEITGTYNDSNGVDIDCLPFETVLMNYPEGYKYLSLNEDLNCGASLFDSDLDGESFDGFSDQSNSSFEGFFRGEPAKPSTTTRTLRNTRSTSVATKFEELTSEKIIRRRSILRPSSLDSSSKEEIKKVEGNRYIKEISSSFGKYQVNYPAEAKSSNIITSTPVNRGLPTFQNYSQSFITPIHPSTSEELKKEANGSRTAMQQKGKKERLRSSSTKPNNADVDSLKSKIDKIILESTRATKEDFYNNFSDSSDNESFEGFQTEYDSDDKDDSDDGESERRLRSKPKEDLNSDDFIGKYCNAIGCTISWLETGAAKSRPVKVTNGVVFELSEFAKTIAWEPFYIADWIFRLRGHVDLEVQNEDMKKINTVIKRRKALCVNMAGKVLLKSSLSAFDTDLFSLPSIEKLHRKRETILSQKFADKNIILNVEKKPNNSDKVKIKSENLENRPRNRRESARHNVVARMESTGISKNKCSDRKDSTPHNKLASRKESTSENRLVDRRNFDQNKARPIDKKLNFNEIDSPPKMKPKSTRRSLRNKTISENNDDEIELIPVPVPIPAKAKSLASNKDLFHTYDNNPVCVSDNNNDLPVIISDSDVPMNSDDAMSSSEQEVTDVEESEITSPAKVEKIKTTKQNFEKVTSSRGRVRKPTAKAQESYISIDSDSDSNEVFSSENEGSDEEINKSHMVKIRESKKNSSTYSQYNENGSSNKVKTNKAQEPFILINSDSEDLIISSDNEVSNGETNQMALSKVENLRENSTSKSLHRQDSESKIIGVKGRVRKPTAKVQESHSVKVDSSENDQVPVINNKDVSPTELYKPKLLHPIFKDGKAIGPYCEGSGVDIKLLNSANKANCSITNGIIYELYHFFRERKASLTSLVHTVYRLKDTAIDKSHIIATMAKIHEMVKVMWEERLSKNIDMPNEEFCLPQLQNKLKSLKVLNVHPTLNKKENVGKPALKKTENLEKTALTKTENIEKLLPPNKKPRLSSSSVIKTTPEILKSSASISSESNSSGGEDTAELSSTNSKHSDSNVPKDSGPMTKTFDLNSTKGYSGKITRGDIVYLYTKWLKKKMEGQTNVFVTDLSKDVEDLIIERKVEFLRIPVGTLMSSSVKLFEEFRKLSKSDMLVAKTYLLEDWIEDIKCIISFLDKKKSASDYNSEDNNQENSNASLNNNFEDDFNEEPLSISNVKDDPTKCSKNIIQSTENSKPLIKNMTDEYEVEKIVGYRIVKIGDVSVTEYRIRWSGFTSKDDSWINESDLNCPEILSKFWEALNKQRALKAKTDAVSVPPVSAPPVSAPPVSVPPVSAPPVSAPPVSAPPVSAATPVLKDRRPTPKNLIKGQENVSPFFGRDIAGSSQKFFDLMIKSLKPDLVDYQHEEETSYMKRVKVSKGEVLNIYDEWRHENQEHLLTGGNQKVDVNVLISRVKDLMEIKKVRNFNSNCIIDVCYRMSLMKAKLKEKKKIEEYLCGDFMELMHISQKHQVFVHKENALRLSNLKQDKLMALSTEELKLKDKIDTLSNTVNESLIIGQFIRDCKPSDNIEKTLENEIAAMKKVLHVEHDEDSSIEMLKRQNSSFCTIKELEAFGVNEDTLDELLTIAIKLN